MIADLASTAEAEKPRFKDGDGSMFSRMVTDSGHIFMLNRLPEGASIGMHTHTNNQEVMYFLSGEGMAVIDGKEEPLKAGVTHFCPKGSSHTVKNTGKEDLVFFAAVLD